MNLSDKLKTLFDAIGGVGNARSVLRWKLLGRPEKLYSFSLSENSLVFDVGGFIGDYSAEILRRYGCRTVIFEPNPLSVEQMSNRFKSDQRVKIFAAALSDRDAKARLTLAEEASRALDTDIKSCQATVEIDLVNVERILSEMEYQKVDLIKINIEGGEYELLDTLIKNDLMNRFSNLLVQFHPFGSDFEKRYDKIAEKLSTTHEIVWQYKFLWEAWELRKP